MENKAKGIRKCLMQGLTVFVTILFLYPISSFAVTHTYHLDDYGLCIWDMSGTYTDDSITGCNISFTLAQDAKGKITGGGSASCSVYEPSVGWIDIDMGYSVKGNIKQKNGIAKVKMSLKFKGNASAMGETFKLTAMEKIMAEISCGDTTINGTVKAKACIKKVGCESFRGAFTDSLPPGMDGSSLLVFVVDQVGKKLLGDGVLELSNLSTINFNVKGKYNSKKDESSFASKGTGDSKGCKLKVKIDESDGQPISIKGKVFGQSLKY